MSTTRRNDPESTRNTIIKAAEQIFVEQGFAANPMSAVARKANVTKSLIHHHCGSKKDLWNEVKRKQFSQFAELKGKSARLIVTMDTPPWYFRWIYGRPGHNAMKKSTLEFCGVKPVKISSIGPVKHSKKSKKISWLTQAQKLGEKIA